jgi:hypothetical protein
MEQTGQGESDLPMNSIQTPFNHVIEVQDGTIDLKPIFDQLDREIRVIKETENG